VTVLAFVVVVMLVVWLLVSYLVGIHEDFPAFRDTDYADWDSPDA
jgi:hypothetical protein